MERVDVMIFGVNPVAAPTLTTKKNLLINQQIKKIIVDLSRPQRNVHQIIFNLIRPN